MTIIFWHLIKSKVRWFSSIVADMVDCSIFQSWESIPGKGEANAANSDLDFGGTLLGLQFCAQYHILSHR